jgi:hypothetical protein
MPPQDENDNLFTDTEMITKVESPNEFSECDM